MGAASSHEQDPSPSQEQQREESLAASTASLPLLRSAFSSLSHPGSSLQDALSLNAPHLASESLPVPPQFPDLLSHIGALVARLFFDSSGGGLSWVGFLRGYNRCCGRMTVSQSLAMLLRLYSSACREAGFDSDLEFDADDDDAGKIAGSLGPSDLLMFLWMCWIMMRCLRISKRFKSEKDVFVLPDVTHLVLSALVSSGAVGGDEGVWKCNVLHVEKRIPVQKLQAWVLTTATGLQHSLSSFVQGKFQACAAASEGNVDTAISDGDNSSIDNHQTYLLTPGRAWAISLSLRNTLNEELLEASFIGINPDNLLYRSTVHGKGLSRFWSSIEGYNGSVLILLSATSSSDASQGDNNSERWVMGVLSEQGFENRDTYFGSSGFLYAICPTFRVLSPSGKEKNFMYCHLRPTVRVYDPKPKPVGLAFGGTMGNERIFLNEDFARVTVRHHAVDKTYQPGSLFPNQGFLPVEASILEVEAWGLGGKRAKEQQDAYKKRENLFSEQRRKVDLKTFTSWEDSPEKMMMDMVSDPNRVHREER